MWITRRIEQRIRDIARQFPALILTGARQTGKTSMLKKVFPDYSYVSLDVASDGDMAENSPQQFLEKYPPPVVIDEVQYAPGVFRNLKVAIDRHRQRKGQFILTGSQSFVLMQNVSDSLAGRCAILELESLCCDEIAEAFDLKPDYPTLLRFLHLGTFPELWADHVESRESFYQAYLQSYLERDLRQIINVTRLRDFDRFLRSCAARAGQVLNQAELARDVGISPATAGQWLSALQAGNIIVLLEPYFTNIGKRLAKSPKLYFTETGLLCYLLAVSRDNLDRSPALGAIWENFIFAELRRYLHWFALPYRAYYYRDQQSREIDFLVDCGLILQLLEVKWTERPEKSDVRTMHQIAALMAKAKPYPIRVARQGVICRTSMDYPIDQQSEAIHWFRFPERLLAKNPDKEAE
jgi:uncharacterized protein